MADTFATVAAATAGGYVRTRTDFGAGWGDLRYSTVFTKHLVGYSGHKSQFELRAVGSSDSSANAADTAALAALNDQRAYRYGRDLDANPNKSPVDAVALTLDVS